MDNELLIEEYGEKESGLLKSTENKTITMKMTDQKFNLVQLGEIVFERLSQNLQTRRSLFDWGRLHIDRQLPFPPDSSTPRFWAVNYPLRAGLRPRGSVSRMCRLVVHKQTE